MPVSGETPNHQALLALLAAAQPMVAPDATVVTIASAPAERALHFTGEDRQ